ncbi:MAG: glycosyltransferase family 2 protein [Candidatus Omnitrophota bacterium]
MQNKKVLIILPAYNEEENIGKVIEDVRKNIPTADILVVNDGSLDSTAKAAKDKEAAVIDLPFNLGIGAAMQAGYKFAYREEYDIAVQCDGDGQHPAYQIKNLIAPLLSNKADIVVGSRFLGSFGYRSSVWRQIGIVLFSKLLSFITKERLTDTTCGFRGLNKKAIKSFSIYYPCDYPEVEALVLAHKEGLRITEVPIRIYRRKQGNSSIGFFDSFYYTIKVLIAVVIDLFEETPLRKEKPV